MCKLKVSSPVYGDSRFDPYALLKYDNFELEFRVIILYNLIFNKEINKWRGRTPKKNRQLLPTKKATLLPKTQLS
jgi:hypothetical protein